MARVGRLAAWATVLGAVTLLIAGANGVQANTKKGGETLAIGDAVTAGVGASDPSLAYVQLFREGISRGGPRHQTELVNLAAPDTGIVGLMAQLAPAIAEIQSRDGDSDPSNNVRVVTVTTGGFDLFGLAVACSGEFPSANCSDAANDLLSYDSALLDHVLSELRSAAGPDVRVLVMSYYNALVNPVCDLHPLASIWDALLEGDAGRGIELGLNTIIRRSAASNGAEVVEAFGKLSSAQLTGDCLTPNDSGHALIADLFLQVFERKESRH